MNQSQFNSRRFSLLLRRQIFMNLPSMWVGLAGIFGVLFIISMATAQLSPNSLPSLIPFYLAFMFISGFIFTSNSLAELNKPKRSYLFLTLPASTFEKLLSSWIISSPLFIVVYALMVFVVFLLSSWKVGDLNILQSLWSGEIVQSMGKYMVCQTVFLLGACTFRSQIFLKTILAIFSLMFFLGITSLVIFYFVFNGEFHGEFNSNEWGDTPLGSTIGLSMAYLISLFLLLVSYFKLKERQV